MKKVLLATTAMVLSAGVAYAESSLSLSGSARLGVTYSGSTPLVARTASSTLTTAATTAASAASTAASAYTSSPTAANFAALEAAVAASAAAAAAVVAADLDTPATDGSFALDNRITIDIGGAIETTSGLTFGGKLRLRSNDGASSPFNGARVYMATNGLEVGIGNIYGAIDSMPNLYHSEVGLTGNGSGDVGGLVGFAYDAYSSQGSSNGVEVMYSAGGVSAHLSVTDADVGSATNRTAAHLAYTAGDWTVAVGGQSSTVAAEDFTAVTVAGTVGTLSVGLSAMDADAGRQITLHGAATMGATNVQVFVSDSTAATATDTSYGIGIAYDLGGASLLAGVEKSLTGQTFADMGVSFKF